MTVSPTVSEPLSGCSWPVIIRKSVDLPAPLGPITPTIPPRGSEKSSDSINNLSPYPFFNFFAITTSLPSRGAGGSAAYDHPEQPKGWSHVPPAETWGDEVLQPLRAWTPSAPRAKDVATAAASVAYPGVEATLRQLVADGWKLAVCTNKPEAPARSLLAALGLGGLFAAIGGADTYPVRKPDPGHLLATLASAGGSVERAIMIGDHRNDILAAAGAGVPAIFAAWGYGGREMAAGAVAVAEDFPQAAHLAAGILRAG